MMNELVQTQNGKEFKLTKEIVRQYLVNGNGKVTDQELTMFIALCKFQNLNPFLREVYLVKYGDSPATTTVGKDVFLKRAQNIKDCAGYNAGIIVMKPDGTIENREGACILNGEELVGGWGKVHKKGWVEPLFNTVALKEYIKRTKEGKPTKFWADMPATMIRKCFDDETEVLTNSGFKLFPDLTDEDLVAQITDDRKIEFVKPTAYIMNDASEQEMIRYDCSKASMVITTDHRFSLVEDGAIVEKKAMDVYNSLRQRNPICIPRTAIIDSHENENWNDNELKLLGYFLADGYCHTKHEIGIKVARARKKESIENLNLHSSFSDIQEKDFPCLGYIIKKPLEQRRYLFSREVSRKIKSVLGNDKFIELEKFKFSARQLKIIIDSWVEFDGVHYHKQKAVYITRENHRDMFMLFAVLCGCSTRILTIRKSKYSKPNYYIAINEIPNTTGRKINFSKIIYNGKTYCVSVPSGRIIVKRDGYSFISGNCALVQALREAFPDNYQGMYSEEEMPVEQAELKRESVEVTVLDAEAIEPEQTQEDEADSTIITVPQQKRMFAIAKGDKTTILTVLKNFGYESSKAVKKEDYQAICDDLQIYTSERE